MNIREAINRACTCSFPVTREEIETECAGIVVSTPTGVDVPLQEVLQTGGTPETFESERAFTEHMMAMAPVACIGRKHYDDRGGVHPHRTHYPYDGESFDLNGLPNSAGD